MHETSKDTLNIIVGGGIAGAALAYQMERRNLNYICIEKGSKTACERKLCANGLTENAKKVLDDYYNIDIEDITMNVISRVKATVFGRKYTFNTLAPMVYIADRGKLYDEIADGLNIEYGKSMVDIKNNHARLSTGETLDGTIYGADGALSRVRRFYEGMPGDYEICYQTTEDKNPYKENEIVLEVDYGLKATEYSVYLEYWFPFGNKVNHGVGFKCYHHNKGNEAFCDFDGSCFKVRSDKPKEVEVLNNIKKVSNMRGYPIGYDFVDNPYLVGDAKGAAYSLTGEGIYPALITAVGALESNNEDYSKFTFKKRMADPIGKMFWIDHRITNTLRTRWILELGTRLSIPVYEFYRRI